MFNLHHHFGSWAQYQLDRLDRKEKYLRVEGYSLAAQIKGSVV